jgi:hypothetical protein
MFNVKLTQRSKLENAKWRALEAADTNKSLTAYDAAMIGAREKMGDFSTRDVVAIADHVKRCRKP